VVLANADTSWPQLEDLLAVANLLLVVGGLALFALMVTKPSARRAGLGIVLVLVPAAFIFWALAGSVYSPLLAPDVLLLVSGLTLLVAKPNALRAGTGLVLVLIPCANARQLEERGRVESAASQPISVGTLALR
jgi:hypothetical protein